MNTRSISSCVLAILGATVLGLGIGSGISASGLPPTPADSGLMNYFRGETAKLADRSNAELQDTEGWAEKTEEWRQQLQEMLGLLPLPPRTVLKPVVTGKVEHDAIVVEKVFFESMPGLYVTANLYLPKGLTNPAPTILYVCGHGPVVSNGVSYGNKVAYQHHGAWFARNGYICLIIDTLQLGEIQGLHHGTYRERMWWWNSRGYTPAGVEAWNCMRALDYLETRPEVDASKFGVTGRSGGGAYSWWIAALDKRIKVAAPVAGITDLQNHVVDGVVEGHCDCMFFVNSFRWDYGQLAALIAPRPLLIVNTDSDSIFPLDGVMRVFQQARGVYRALNVSNLAGLVIAPGPHKDTQDIQVPVFRWFNRHLKGEDGRINAEAEKLFEPQQLKVFSALPTNSINTNIHLTFVPRADPPVVPTTPDVWDELKAEWISVLREKTFAGWPRDNPGLELEKKTIATRQGLRLQTYEFTSQPGLKLRLYVVHKTALSRPERIYFTLLDDGKPNQEPTAKGRWFTQPSSYSRWLEIMQQGFAEELTEETALSATKSAESAAAGFEELKNGLQSQPIAAAFLAPRGYGLTHWSGDARKQVQLRRRFMMLGQTLDGMRVWDIRRGIQALKASSPGRNTIIRIQARGDLAADALYASLFEPTLSELELWNLPSSHMNGPDLLNVLRILDLPQVMGMVLEQCRVRLHDANAADWSYPIGLAPLLGWPDKRFQLDPAAPVIKP